MDSSVLILSGVDIFSVPKIFNSGCNFFDFLYSLILVISENTVLRSEHTMFSPHDTATIFVQIPKALDFKILFVEVKVKNSVKCRRAVKISLKMCKKLLILLRKQADDSK